VIFTPGSSNLSKQTKRGPFCTPSLSLGLLSWNSSMQPGVTLRSGDLRTLPD
jgi:hypothetical protein